VARVIGVESGDWVRRGSSFGAVAAAYAELRPGYPDDAVRWAVAPLGRDIRGLRVVDLGAGTGIRLFPAVERAEFPNAQRCTIESLVALVGTHSRLLVMPAPERDRVLSQVADYLRGRPETSDGEFTAPLVTLVLRATRETSGAPGPAL
jgi:hypothetical protein